MNLMEKLKSHLVDDWRDAYKWARNYAITIIAVLAVIQQYCAEYIPSWLMMVVAVTGIALRLWKQGDSANVAAS